MNTIQKRLFGATAVAAVGLGTLGASNATAAPVDQNGLVNVFVDDTTVQIPIAVAANVCGVAVNVIATQATGGDTTCDAFANAEANNRGGRDRTGPVRQSGLINLFLDDTTVQVPVAVAANLCDMDVNVLARQLGLGDVECDAASNGSASN